MFIISTSTYPPSKNRDMIERFQKAVAVAMPSFVKRHYVFTSAGGEPGIKVVGIYEVSDDKVADGMKELLRYFQNFYDVEGYRYSMEYMLTAQEAIAALLAR